MKILLAVDGSKHATRAEEFLARLGGRRPHRVEAVYVTPPYAPARPGGAPSSGLAPFRDLPASRSGGEKSFPQVLAEGGVRMLDHVIVGLKLKTAFRLWPRLVKNHNIPDGILRAAEKEKADLVVLGSRGLTALDTFLMGSVSQQVTRHAKGATLVVRERPAGEGPVKVLAAVDGSRGARDAVAFLKELASPKGVALTLIHVVESPLVWAGPAFGGGIDPTALVSFREELARRRKVGRRLLADARRQWTPAFGRVEALLAEGPPSHEIIAAAKTGGFALIVMGARGLSGVKRFFLGSVSQKVTAHAPCSVLVAPSDRRSDKSLKGASPQAGGRKGGRHERHNRR